MAREQPKCANSDCNCDAEKGSKYCSNRCEEMGGGPVTKCPCGHAGCTAAVTARATPMGGHYSFLPSPVHSLKSCLQP
jgi:hypothetical protein